MSWRSTGFVGPGEQRSFDVMLQAGTSNTIYVRPEVGGSIDLDLHVYDENRALVSDEHADIDAACRMTPAWSGPFHVVVSSTQGSGCFTLLIKTVGD